MEFSFSINANDLKSHLDVLKSVINSKNVIQILDYYLFEQKEGLLKITASDLETRIDTVVKPNSTEGEGLIAINAKQLTDMLGMFGNEPLTFATKDFSVVVKNASGKYKVTCDNGEDYPKQNPINGESFKIESSIISRGIEKTLFAVSDGSTKPILSGILFEINNNSIKFVATDSHKLSVYTRNGLELGMEKSVVVPAKTCSILKNITSQGGDVKVSIDENSLKVSNSSFAVTTKLIDGKYPNYNAVIPTEGSITMKIEKKDFMSKMKRVSYFSNQSTNLSKLSVVSNELTLSSQDFERSNSATEVMGCEHEGSDIEIGFQSKYLMSVVDQVDGENVLFSMSGSNKAALIKQDIVDENESLLMLIMPMMI